MKPVLNFKSIRGRAGTTVEPHRVKNETCFLLLLTNWVSLTGFLYPVKAKSCIGSPEQQL